MDPDVRADDRDCRPDKSLEASRAGPSRPYNRRVPVCRRPARSADASPASAAVRRWPESAFAEMPPAPATPRVWQRRASCSACYRRGPCFECPVRGFRFVRPARQAMQKAAGTPPTRSQVCFSWPSVGDARRAALCREPGNEIRLGYDAGTQIELAACRFRSLTRPVSRKL